MNIIKKLLYSLPLAGMILTSCTDVENIQIEHIGGYNTGAPGSEEYYAKLREYHASAANYARPVAFGWFSNWSPTGTMRRGYLSSMPDSIDIVSMWSGAPSASQITPEQKADKEFVQKVKGIKLLEVSLLSHIGKGRTPESIYTDIYRQAEEEKWPDHKIAEAKKQARWNFWGYSPSNNLEKNLPAYAKFAKAICDSLVTGEWDGFDIDWEPGMGFNDSDGSLDGTTIKVLVKEMGKYIGPASDPEGKGHKLLVIDGLINYFGADMEEYVDYWITQAYGRAQPSYRAPGGNDRKLIITDNFESNFANGGVLLHQARWMPDAAHGGYKGGVGAYRFDNDYDNKPDYKWMRQAIQINQQVFNDWKKNQKPTM
ncbi:glycoside hydrolase family 18 [Alistipes sp.]|uniref:glycoside hydrolase family 18 n=1 Tax=Alistipes sp. TaxID=1872444 RepID=UPI0025BCBE37|nr:glycoside hydrolase family 18 [Alistipes sp.]